jgi:hypothetical protein
MMERQIIKILLISLIVASGCYYDSAENLYPSSGCVTNNMSLQSDIVPILQSNCYVCHSAEIHSGDVILEGYSELSKQAKNGKLLGAIKHETGFMAMPQNAPKLGTCEISKIEHWVTEGSQNN